MKIAYFFTELGLSGGPLVHYNVLNYLKSRGHELLVVTCNEIFPWEYDSHLPFLRKRKNFVVKTLSGIKAAVRGRFALMPPAGSARDEIKRITDRLLNNYLLSGFNAETFVGTHTYTGDALYLASAGNNAFIYDLHFEELMFGLLADRMEIRKINLLPMIHMVNSAWLQYMFRNSYGSEYEIVYPVINDKVFNLKPERKRYDSEVVIIVSYCDPYRPFKGMPQQMEILQRVKQRFGPKVEIVIYGHDMVPCGCDHSYAGWLTHADLSALYSSAHILFMPSWFESFPLPPIEAMACGCVPVANKYGTEDYLIHGQNGFVINPFDSDGAVNVLCELIQNREMMYFLAIEAYSKSREFISDAGMSKLEKILQNGFSRTAVDIDKVIIGNITEFEQIYPVIV